MLSAVRIKGKNIASASKNICRKAERRVIVLLLVLDLNKRDRKDTFSSEDCGITVEFIFQVLKSMRLNV